MCVCVPENCDFYLFKNYALTIVKPTERGKLKKQIKQQFLKKERIYSEQHRQQSHKKEGEICMKQAKKILGDM